MGKEKHWFKYLLISLLALIGLSLAIIYNKSFGLYYIILSMIVLSIVLVIEIVIYNKNGFDQERRKEFHMLSSTYFVIPAIAIDTIIDRWYFSVSLSIILVLLLAFETIRLNHSFFNEIIYSKLEKILKQKEKKTIISSVWVVLVFLLLVLFFQKPVILIVAMVTAYSDPLAALVGMSYGGKKNWVGKTKLGMLTYYVSTLIFSLSVFTVFAVSVSFFFLIPLAAIPAVIEGYTDIIDDNFVPPIIFALALEIVIKIF